MRRFALQRLMDFILGVISTGVHPWRLVIGRLGRMGHGELKSNYNCQPNNFTLKLILNSIFAF